MSPQNITNKSTKQTGPITATGKAISSQNARTHGATSKQLIQPGENRADYDQLLTNLRRQFETTYQYNGTLINDLADKTWRAQRNAQKAIEYETELFTKKPKPSDWTKDEHHDFQLLRRYEGEAERAAKRILQTIVAAQHAELNQLRLERERDKNELARINHAADMIDAKDRLHRYQEGEKRRAFHEQIKRECDEIEKQPKKDGEISQHITVHTLKNGDVRPLFDPPNRRLLKNIEVEAQRGGNIAWVTRFYEFVGPVPPEYQWLDIEQPADPKENVHWLSESWMSAEDFQRVAKAEKQIRWNKVLHPESKEMANYPVEAAEAAEEPEDEAEFGQPAAA